LEVIMMSNTIFRVVLLGASLGFTVPVFAQDMPPTQTSNGVTFVTGGIGQSRIEAFRKAAKDYNLRATFTAPGGAFMADVKVTLKDAKGNTLVTTVSGPLFYAQVPPGRYELIAAYGDQRFQRKLEVSQSGAATTEIVFKVPVGQ
jgi:hypothetical protein